MHIRGFALLVLLPLSMRAVHANEKVDVQVYYETRCRHSTNFIQQQLYPAWKELEQYLRVTFVPDGFAKRYRDADGELSFICHHGPFECDGNKMQACALNELKNDSSLSMQYVACFMSHDNPAPFKKKCFENVAKSNESQLQFEECVNSAKGDVLVSYYADLTESVGSMMNGVPTLTFNGVFDFNLDSRSLEDFKGVVCDLINSTPKPAACLKIL